MGQRKMLPMMVCERVAGVEMQRECLRAIRVLVVDDHEDTVIVLQMLLEHFGYDVRVAFSAQEALSIASRFIPDLGIIDIRLPDMSGYELARKLREDIGECGLRLIALSGIRAPDYERAACFDEVVRKPIGGSELKRLVRRLRPR
jgi:CheY-like chemotaxis protein